MAKRPDLKGNKFAKGHKKKGGRKKGIPNKVSMLLKDAIIQAAIELGADGKGRDGLLGYCMDKAKRFPKVYLMLLARVIPLHVTGNIQHDHAVYETKEELIQVLHERGIPIDRIYH